MQITFLTQALLFLGSLQPDYFIISYRTSFTYFITVSLTRACIHKERGEGGGDTKKHSRLEILQGSAIIFTRSSARSPLLTYFSYSNFLIIVETNGMSTDSTPLHSTITEAFASYCNMY
jgi:hypothetical protein